ncbi:MAG TPA: YebC/PmpR family DNA-binding transcriptional regulator, partial [Fimbriimonadaceae bacterium]|nr:YebC/PmpR family DNA-binding transcriptional regulator [Fimbriimonadaceae bacterium]
DDVVSDEESFTIYTTIENLHTTNEALEKQGVKTTDVGLTFVATNKTDVSVEDAPKLMRLLEALEDLDDVQESYVNVDVTEEMLEAV